MILGPEIWVKLFHLRLQITIFIVCMTKDSMKTIPVDYGCMIYKLIYRSWWHLIVRDLSKHIELMVKNPENPMLKPTEKAMIHFSL